MSRGQIFKIFLRNAPRFPSKSYQAYFTCYTSWPNTLNLLTTTFNVATMVILFERLTLKPKPTIHAHSLIYFYWHLVARYSDLLRKLLLGLQSRSLSLNFLTPFRKSWICPCILHHTIGQMHVNVTIIILYFCVLLTLSKILKLQAKSSA